MDEETDGKNGAKFHRGQPNEPGYVDKVNLLEKILNNSCIPLHSFCRDSCLVPSS